MTEIIPEARLVPDVQALYAFCFLCLYFDLTYGSIRLAENYTIYAMTGKSQSLCAIPVYS